MAIKVYGIDGKTAACWPISNPTGDVRFTMTFRNGCLDDMRKRPATCTVTDPVEQVIIENHSLFRRGIIRLISVSAPAEAAKTADINAENKKAAARKNKQSDRTVINTALKDEATGFTTYPEVKTLGDVTNVLLSLGANMSALRDENEILRVASEDYKLTFPNYEG